jgi:hypothetical protein
MPMHRAPEACLQRAISDERLRQLAQDLHRLGPRPIFEFLREVAAGADLYECLEQYARLDPAIVKYLGVSEMLPNEEVQS